METRAKAKFIKVSPKKMRLVANLIRGLDVADALVRLRFTKKAATTPLTKLLNSAIANAEENQKLSKDNLYIKEITVDDGPTLKRWRPRAFGRATSIRKRSSHIVLLLSEKVPTKVKEGQFKKEDKKDDIIKVDSMDELKALEAESESDAPALDTDGQIKEKKNQGPPTKGGKSGNKGFMNKIFNRKSGDK